VKTNDVVSRQYVSLPRAAVRVQAPRFQL
jgi:hypothetical protein